MIPQRQELICSHFYFSFSRYNFIRVREGKIELNWEIQRVKKDTDRKQKEREIESKIGSYRKKERERKKDTKTEKDSEREKERELKKDTKIEKDSEREKERELKKDTKIEKERERAVREAVSQRCFQMPLGDEAILGDTESGNQHTLQI